jgi:ubiquinone/menaquinone biosynthesis C-methylase UbiE
MFSAAAAYERFMGRWSRRLAVAFATFAGIRDGDRVLDVGCGTGALCAAILAQHRKASVTGVDPAASFIEGCRANYPASRFVVGDAQRLPFGDREFDASLASLVLAFVPTPSDALAEMKRVTVRGGTVAATIWDHAEGMTMLRAFWDAADQVDPSVKPVEAQPSLDRDVIDALWREADLKDICFEPLTVEMPFSSFDDYWSPFLAGQGPAGAYAAAAPEETREAIVHILRARFLGDGPDRPFTIHSRAWAIRGAVPV